MQNSNVIHCELSHKVTIPIFIHRYHNYDVDVYIKVVQDNNCKKAFLNLDSISRDSAG